MKLITELTNVKENQMYYLKNAIRDFKSVYAEKKARLNLGLLSDMDNRNDFSNRVLRHQSNINFYRNDVVNTVRKISILKALTEGETFQETMYDIEKIDLEIDDNFSLADEILESGEHTERFDSYTYWNDRVENNFIGTYPITIDRIDDYVEFLKVLIDDMITLNIFPNFSVSFQEWKAGKKTEGKRETKLNKYLRKKGFSQYTLDYYSKQVKTEKTLYITVSDKVQHITGMSYFSNMEWDGISGSSCQNPENDYEESLRLLGSLHDNKLLVTFLHENLEDLEEIEEGERPFLARSMARLTHVDGKQFLITTNHYGNNNTKNEIEKGLQQLNKFGIFTLKQMSNGSSHKESTNGQCYISEETEVHVYETIDEYVDCECPMCGGSGKYEVETRTNYVDIKCPACNGNGNIETNVYVEIDEYVDVEEEEEINPYNEGYQHYGSYTYIDIDKVILFKEYK